MCMGGGSQCGKAIGRRGEHKGGGDDSVGAAKTLTVARTLRVRIRVRGRNAKCMKAYTSEQKCLRPHKDYKRTW